MRPTIYIYFTLTWLNFNLAVPLVNSKLSVRTNPSFKKFRNAYYEERSKNLKFEETPTISKRDDITLLTEFFTVLNDSNLVVPLLKILATNKVTEPLLVDAIIAILKTQNLDDLLAAVDKSNIAVDIVLKTLQDSKFFPGLFNIVQGLMNGGTTSPTKSSLDNAALSSAVAPIIETYSSSEFSGLHSTVSSLVSELGILKSDNSGLLSALSPVLNPILSSVGLGGQKSSSTNPDSTKSVSNSKKSSSTKATSTAPSSSDNSVSLLSELLSLLGLGLKLKLKLRRSTQVATTHAIRKRDNPLLDSLLESLEKSGLAMSVIYLIITDPDMAPFARDLIIQIVKKKAITLDGLLLALNNTNLLNDAIIGTLTSPHLGITIS